MKSLRALVACGFLVASCVTPTVATPSPTASVPVTVVPATLLPTATPPPGAVVRPGLITRDGATPWVVRTETDVTPIRTLPDSGWVISADGARMTHWTESAAGAELHITQFGGSERIVATFAGRRPGGVVWSVDGTGLLVALAEPPDTRTRVLMAVEISTGAAREVYRGIGPSGASVVPLVWRRSPDVFAAYETGPGGYNFGYTVIRPGQAPVRTEPDREVTGMTASSDGSLVLGSWVFDNVIKVWPLDDFAKKTELRPAASEQLATPRWWPDRLEVAFAAGRLADGAWRDIRVERWDPVSGARSVLKRLPDAGSLGGFLVRADGSGLLTMGAYPPGAWEVTDLRSGTTTAIPQRPGENILRTVLIRQ